MKLQGFLINFFIFFDTFYYSFAHCKWLLNGHCIIGATLNEPHTSMTSYCARVCVSMLACLDRPLTGNLKSAFKF